MLKFVSPQVNSSQTLSLTLKSTLDCFLQCSHSPPLHLSDAVLNVVS